MSRARAELSFRRTLLEMTGQVGPYLLTSVFSVPDDIGAGVLIVGSEDLFATWTLTEEQQLAEMQSFRRTGPASRDVFYVERGGRLSCQVHQVAPGLHTDQLTGLTTGNGNIPGAPSVPTLYARFYPMNRPQFERGFQEGHWLRFLPDFENAQEGIEIIFSASVLSEFGQISSNRLGYAPGFCRHFHLGLGVNSISTRLLDPLNFAGLVNFGAGANFSDFIQTWPVLQVNLALPTDGLLIWTRSG